MRRALALVAAALPLALAACSVDVEGAPCATPGTTTDCPSGQACGPSGTCSKHVGACVAAGTFCTPGVGQRCAGTRRETCVAGDDCGVWTTLDDCGDQQLVCHDAGGPPACVCAAPASEIVVDRTAPEGSLVPTGAPEPLGCRFTTLTAALSYARTQPGAPGIVKAVGTPTAADPAVFSAGETFPLQVPSGVTLTTASVPPAPDAWIVSADPDDSRNVVELESGATLEGFTLRSVSAAGDGLVVACEGDTAPAVASGVRIEGRGVLRYGVRVTGTCGLAATDLAVSGAARSGVFVSTASPATGVTATGGSIEGCGESGAEVVGGLLTLRGRTTTGGDVLFEVSSNGRHGIRAAPVQPSPSAIALDVHLADVHENGEVGILVKELGASSTVAVTGSRIRKNTGTTAFSVYGNSRIAGGVLLWGSAPEQFDFQGNTVCANATDQIGVYSDDRWRLSADDCTTSNLFARPGAGYYVYSTTEIPEVEVPAVNNRWSPNPPTGLVVRTTIAPSCGSVPTVPTFCQ